MSLHRFASERFSPVRFDRGHTATPDDVDDLLVAAGRSPSAGNAQPWSFIVGVRGDSVHARLLRHLARSSSVWAADASILLANLSHRFVEDSAMEFTEFAHYDLGQSLAHLTFQAHSMGLQVHQFRAFDREAISLEFQVPPHWEVTTMAAIGRACAGAEQLTGPGTSRERATLEEITWARAPASSQSPTSEDGSR